MSTPNAPQIPAADRFDEVLAMIQSARQQAAQAVNTRLIELYWQVGAHISRKIESAEWGDAVVRQLAEHWLQPNRACVGLHAATCFACVSSMRFIALKRKSHHWCDNYPGLIT